MIVVSRLVIPSEIIYSNQAPQCPSKRLGQDEEEEEEDVGDCGSPPIAEASLIVPIVGNHNQQRNNINANFEGSSSYLAILYDPLLGTFSK